MKSNILVGILAGLIAGLVFGLMMQMMTAPTPHGNEMPMMAMVAQVVHSDSVIVGWLYHLFNSAFIGGLFAWLFGNRLTSYMRAAGYGTAYWMNLISMLSKEC
ncbi:hypothetical protein L0152_02405 [bacterium]|nr:hypothetical protein [bacterium]